MATLHTPAARAGGYRALLYVLPALLVVVGIVYLGIGYNAYVSTLEWSGIGDDRTPVGLDNYVAAFTDPVFWTSLSHVAIFAVVTIVAQMAIGLTMAILLSGRIFLGGVYKVVMFLPVVLAPAAIAVAFRDILSPGGGVNEVLRAIGLDGLTRAWIAEPETALMAIAVINIWAWTGFSFILYQAALGQIDTDHIEAAQLDGAGRLRTLWSIVVPQLSGTHTTLVLIGVIGALKTFDIVYLTTGGGPGRSTEFLTTYIYKTAIDGFQAGYAAALSILLLVISLVLTLIQMRVNRFGRS